MNVRPAQIGQIWLVSVLAGVAVLARVAHAEYHSVLFRLAMFGVRGCQTMIQVPDLAAAVDALHARGVRFRHEIVTSIGVRQTLVEDPSGNPVELFEPIAGYHERASRTGGQ